MPSWWILSSMWPMRASFSTTESEYLLLEGDLWMKSGRVQPPERFGPVHQPVRTRADRRAVPAFGAGDRRGGARVRPGRGLPAAFGRRDLRRQTRRGVAGQLLADPRAARRPGRQGPFPVGLAPSDAVQHQELVPDGPLQRGRGARLRRI